MRANRPLPFTLGHEIAGTVEAAGPDAAGVAKGQRYAAYPWIGCGRCELCARGDEHMCNAPRALGITVDGGYATHVLVPHPRYLLDVEGIAPEIAGPLMCSGLTGYGAIKKALNFLRAGPLLIVGPRRRGHDGASVRTRAHGQADLRRRYRCRKARCGRQAWRVAGFRPGGRTARKEVMKASGGGFGAVVDFAGSEKSLAFAQGLVAKGGAAIVVGLIGGKFSLPVPMFPLRALTIMGSYVGSPAEAARCSIW